MAVAQHLPEASQGLLVKAPGSGQLFLRAQCLRQSHDRGERIGVAGAEDFAAAG